MTVGVPMTVLRISWCRASDTDLRGDFVNACSVGRAGGPQYWGRGGNAERLLIYLLLRNDNNYPDSLQTPVPQWVGIPIFECLTER